MIDQKADNYRTVENILLKEKALHNQATHLGIHFSSDPYGDLGQSFNIGQGGSEINDAGPQDIFAIDDGV